MRATRTGEDNEDGQGGSRWTRIVNDDGGKRLWGWWGNDNGIGID